VAQVANTSVGNILENRQRFAHLFDDTRKSDISIETFYQLLIAEMSNQDPLDPMSNTEFISQMAAFTSLQVQQEALYYNNSNYASSLAGKTVIVAASASSRDPVTGQVRLDVQTGVVESVNFSGGQFTVTVNGREFPIQNIMEVLDGSKGNTSGSDGAFATSLIGKYVTVGWVTDGGQARREEGFVERIEIDKGEISIIIDGLSYPLQSVIKVEPLESAKDDDSSQPGGITIEGDDDE
jgi:flagellar basal-body rod modification protein FlgD